jgi:hypothetical protein
VRNAEGNRSSTTTDSTIGGSGAKLGFAGATSRDAATSENTQEEQNITVIRPQFSWVGRNTWSKVSGDLYGLDGMIFTSFRYYLS